MKWTGRALFWIVLLFLLTLKTHRTYIGQGDEPHYIVATESLYLDHDLDLRNNYESPYLRDFPALDHAVMRQPDGRQLPFHALGLSILGIPVYAIAHAIIRAGSTMGDFTSKTERWIFIKNCFSFSMMVLAGFLSVLLFKIFTALTNDKKLSWALALMFSLSPPLLAYGLVFFTELPSAFLVAWLALRLIEESEITVLDALLLGALPWLHAKNYTVALMFGALRIQQKRLDKSIIAPVLTAVAFWSAAIFMNYHLWGGMSPSAAWSTSNYKTFDAKFLPVALPGLIFDRSFGLLVFAPIYALFPCGWALLFARRRTAAIQLLLLIGSYLVSIAGFKFWWGGWSPGPRYIVPIVPLLAVGSTMFVQAAWEKSAAWRKTACVMIAITAVLSLLYWQVPTLLWNQEDGVNLFLIHWFGDSGRRLQEYLPNFFLPPIAPQFQTAFYAAAIAVLSVAAFRKLNGYWNTR